MARDSATRFSRAIQSSFSRLLSLAIVPASADARNDVAQLRYAIERQAYYPQGSCDAVGLATALSWIEFRNLPGFRDGHPRLKSWYERFAERSSMLATPLAGEVVD